MSCKLTVGLYKDRGVSPSSYQYLKHLLATEYDIVTLNALQVNKADFPKDMRAFVMPGGADVPYHNALQGKGTKNIRDFVETGGVYVGICAGSYFAAQCIDFTCYDGTKITGLRELGFFPGTVYGPAYGEYKSGSHDEARIVSVNIGNRLYQAYFNGGGFFELMKDASNITVLATYADMHKIAVVRAPVKQGNAFLCGIHPEYNNAFLEDKIMLPEKGQETLKHMLKQGVSAELTGWFLKELQLIIQPFQAD